MLSKTQAVSGRTAKQEQERISPNHIPTIFHFSVLLIDPSPVHNCRAVAWRPRRPPPPLPPPLLLESGRGLAASSEGRSETSGEEQRHLLCVCVCNERRGGGERMSSDLLRALFISVRILSIENTRHYVFPISIY